MSRRRQVGHLRREARPCSPPSRRPWRRHARRLPAADLRGPPRGRRYRGRRSALTRGGRRWRRRVPARARRAWNLRVRGEAAQMRSVWPMPVARPQCGTRREAEAWWRAPRGTSSFRSGTLPRLESACRHCCFTPHALAGARQARPRTAGPRPTRQRGASLLKRSLAPKSSSAGVCRAPCRRVEEHCVLPQTIHRPRGLPRPETRPGRGDPSQDIEPPWRAGSGRARRPSVPPPRPSCMMHTRKEADVDDHPPVTTKAGRLSASHIDGVTRYLGIPYAAAPAGGHRFAAPAPTEPWTGSARPGTMAPAHPNPRCTQLMRIWRR